MDYLEKKQREMDITFCVRKIIDTARYIIEHDDMDGMDGKKLIESVKRIKKHADAAIELYESIQNA